MILRCPEKSKVKEFLRDAILEILSFLIEFITGVIVGVIGVGILYLILCGTNVLGVNPETLILLWHIGCISSAVVFGLLFVGSFWMATATSFVTHPGIFLAIAVVNSTTLSLDHPAFALSIIF
ncbi:hypothetical protein [Acetobacterium wieringae]|uniref:hypothetical protein n=1 Tax=Acetobacterium wieringae TaxID=52694 RepID=UPI002B215458|nr:hypothetical protein [Acetobacterium wieringae]MEA4805045.1 hypothetical protein [Acetobacterium wieringae]